MKLNKTYSILLIESGEFAHDLAVENARTVADIAKSGTENSVYWRTLKYLGHDANFYENCIGYVLYRLCRP